MAALSENSSQTRFMALLIDGDYAQPSLLVLVLAETAKYGASAVRRGWGLARAAELHGIPRPLHLLEIKDEIPLSAEQVSATSAHWLEHSKPRSATVENGMLHGSGHMQPEQGDEQMTRDVVYPFEELVEVSTACYRRREPDPEYVQRLAHRPRQQVPRNHDHGDESEQSPMHDPRHEVEDRHLLGRVGRPPSHAAPHAPQEEQPCDRTATHVKGVSRGAGTSFVGEEQRDDQDRRQPMGDDGKERVAVGAKSWMFSHGSPPRCAATRTSAEPLGDGLRTNRHWRLGFSRGAWPKRLAEVLRRRKVVQSGRGEWTGVSMNPPDYVPPSSARLTR